MQGSTLAADPVNVSLLLYLVVLNLDVIRVWFALPCFQELLEAHIHVLCVGSLLIGLVSLTLAASH